MARSPSTNMNFWARAPLNLVADRVKNSVPPLLRTLRFCDKDRAHNYTSIAETTWQGSVRERSGVPVGKGESADVCRERRAQGRVWGWRKAKSRMRGRVCSSLGAAAGERLCGSTGEDGERLHWMGLCRGEGSMQRDLGSPGCVQLISSLCLGGRATADSLFQ